MTFFITKPKKGEKWLNIKSKEVENPMKMDKKKLKKKKKKPAG